MSVAQLESELSTLNSAELDRLEVALRRERARRQRNVLSHEETQLYQIINQPMPGSERFRALEPAWEAGTLSEEERAELLQIVEAREELNAQRITAFAELVQLKGVPFETLWRQIMGTTPPPRLVAG